MMGLVVVVGGGVVGMSTCLTRARRRLATVLVENDPTRRARIADGLDRDTLDVVYGEPAFETRSHLKYMHPRHLVGLVADLSCLGDTIDTVEAVIVCVGTSGHGGEIDPWPVVDVVGAIREALHVDHTPVIVVRSTVRVDSVSKIRMAAEHLPVAFVPEFLVEGQAGSPERLVIGADDERTFQRAAAALGFTLCRDEVGWYTDRSLVLSVSPTEAVLVKLGTNYLLRQRAAFTAEMASLAEQTPGVDAARVLGGIGQDPRIGERYLGLGLGPGGSCLEKDASALLTAFQPALGAPLVDQTVKRRARALAVLIGLATDRYLSMPRGYSVLLWGLGFKPNTYSRRRSPVGALIDALVEFGIAERFGLTLVDPGLDSSAYHDHKVNRPEDPWEPACVAIALHRSAAEPGWCERVAPGGVIVDPYRILDPELIHDRELWVGGRMPPETT